MFVYKLEREILTKPAVHALALLTEVKADRHFLKHFFGSGNPKMENFIEM